MEAFKQLGDDIEQRWRACGYATDAFPEIATRALTEHDLPGRIAHLDLVRWALSNTVWPPQFGSRFGQPPINVYVGSGFFIEVITWVESTTSIHQHNFSGAFQVFEGSSMHSRYTFDEHERINNRVLVGETRFENAELLTRGDVRQILSGNRLIHALFHLEHPSATIVVRTGDEATGPQYSYEKPHLALDPFYAPEPYSTQARLLRMLASIDSPQLGAALHDAIAISDPWTAYRFLAIAIAHIDEQARIDELIEAARRRHGTLAQRMAPCLAEARRQDNIVLRRAQIKDAAPRFLLALLLNLPARGPILAMVRRRYPHHDPVAWIVDQLRDLAAKDQVGLTLDDVSLRIFDGLLRGDELDGIKRTLERSFGRREVERQSSALGGLIEQMKAALLFKPLFA